MTILAYEMNGLRCENELRSKMVKWIAAIEFVHDFADLGAGQGGYNEDHEFYGYRMPIWLHCATWARYRGSRMSVRSNNHRDAHSAKVSDHLQHSRMTASNQEALLQIIGSPVVEPRRVHITNALLTQ